MRLRDIEGFCPENDEEAGVAWTRNLGGGGIVGLDSTKAYAFMGTRMGWGKGIKMENRSNILCGIQLLIGLRYTNARGRTPECHHALS